MSEDIKHIGEKRQGRSLIEKPKQESFERDYSRYDFRYSTDHYTYISKPGLSRSVVEEISRIKNEPAWMREFRLQAYEVFMKKPLPMWGADLRGINFDAITYYARPMDQAARSWDDVPEEIKKTFDRLGIPEAERKFLAGVGAQYDSEVVYHSIREALKEKGVIFLGMDDGLKEYPEIVKEYFGTVIPKEDNKFAALNSAVWSGGSFIYVPPGVQVEIPLQAYFRINAANMGQFERTLIIADEGSKVHYIEGCVVAGTPIATNPDYKPVETIRVGDRVLTHKGRYRTVRRIQTRHYSGPLFSIRVWGDAVAPLEITEEHPMLAVKRSGRDKPTEWNLAWITPANLRKGDYLVIPRRKEIQSRTFGDFAISLSVNDKKAVYQEVVEHVPSTPEFFRLAGYFLAEGSILNNFYLSFSFGESERAYIDDVKSLLTQVFGVTKIHELPHKRNHGISLTVSSARLARIFAHFGTSSSTRRIPDWMLLEEPAKQAQLIVGFFRGDGNYLNVKYANGNRFEKFRLSTTSKTLAYQLRDILLRLGIVASINASDRSSEHRQTMYTLVVGGAFLKPFGDLVGIPIAEGRNGKRATRFLLDDHYAYLPIRKITSRPVSDLMVYNFSVEADESYVAGGVAVHNCTAPVYSRESLHSAVVELIAKRGAHLRYTTLQNWSNDVYNLVTKRAVAYEDATVEWVDANIGCLTADTKVFLNPRGATSIRDVKANDWIYALDLNSMQIVKRRVNGVVCTGIKPVFKLTTENFREIKATANHLFLTLHRPTFHKMWQLAWKPLETLKPGDYIALVQGLPDEGGSYRIDYKPELKRTKIRPRIPEETSEDLMWLLGLYLGDGFLERAKSGAPRRIYFAVPGSDPARPKLIALLKQLFELDWRPKGISVTVNSAIFAGFILKLGLAGTAREKRVPHWVFSLPLRQKLAFIEGYLDADGHIRKHLGKDGKLYGQLTFTSCNRELLEDLKLLMISCGLNPLKISSYSKDRVLLDKYERVYTTHYLNVNLSDLEAIRSKSAQNRGVEFVRIFSIEPLGEEAVYDIEVEGAHNFLANGLVAHNSRVTMKYPSVYLLGKGAKADILSVAYAGKGQHQDTGGKVIHAAPYTTSTIISKSVSKGGGRTTYRGWLKVIKGAYGAKSSVRCDALLLDEHSRSDTYPHIEIGEDRVTVGHEATVGKVSEDQIFYLMSRGLSEGEALSMIVLGFMEPFTKTLPMEYAIEFNRLIQLEMSGSVG